MNEWLDNNLIPEWRDAHKYWSVQLCVGFGLFNGAVLGISAFYSILSPWWFLVLNIVGYGSIAAVRYLNQRAGITDAE